MDIKENIILASYTTLRVGGPAKFFCEAKNEKEILEALEFAEEKKLPVFVLGGGSNILVSDKGFDGLVIKILNTKYRILDTKIDCGAGCLLSKIVSESVKAGLTGLEWAAGIPGTVGGAVWGNAGAFGYCIAEAVESVKVIDTGALSTGSLAVLGMTASGCQFSYRDSIFKENPNLIIFSVLLKLKKGDSVKSQQKVKEILAARKEKQPFYFPSSGSFFKNPIVKNRKIVEEYKRDTGNKSEKGVIPAGYIIEALGLKGKKIGGAQVSDKHANFIMNTGKAKAEDFIILAAIIKTRVRNKFGIQLKEEVQMVGF